MAKNLSVSPAARRSRLRVILIIINFLVIAGLAATSGLSYRAYKNLESESNMTLEQKNEKLVAQVSKVYDLPKDEKPTIAVVNDEQKFKEEYKVFTTAKKDDKLLIYQKAGVAILYRESEKKVIGTVNVSVRSEANVQIIGNDTTNAAVESTLKSKIPSGIKIASKTAATGTHASTTVIDVSTKNSETAKQIADALGASVAQSMPAGETAASGVDIVVVLASPAAPAEAVQP